MSDYFSTPTYFKLGQFRLLITPSEYDAGLSAWTKTKLSLSLCESELPIANLSIEPGSDQLKVIPSEDDRFVAVVCESQWFEDLYLCEISSLRIVASFEGSKGIDGASEGLFLGSDFITLPTFSFEGGCGGLRKVSLSDGRIEQLVPASFFYGLRVWMDPEGANESKSPRPVLPTPFGLIRHIYNRSSGLLVLDYVPGRLSIVMGRMSGWCDKFHYEFSPWSDAGIFKDHDGKVWRISDNDRRQNWWLQNYSKRALELLRLGVGRAGVAFRGGQEDAIRHVVEGRGRLLVVRKTGWGKSFVYFIATKLLRESGHGPALLVSPLLALMRNQIAAAARMGVRAMTIHSENADEWTEVEAAVASNKVDILLISPERLANERFRAEVLAGTAERISLLVIDEAHCISDWGHDFRPHYRLIERVVRSLPSNLRLLATTATANNRVMADLEAVLGPDLAVSRGNLNRPSLALQTIRLASQAERLAWLAESLPTLAGSGIIYTLTVRDAELVAAWLKSRGLNVESYTGETGDRRPELEQALLDNRVKALVATTALGMGFDKPDLAFVIHYQTPGSVVAYYQQVGRAGRALDVAYGVLLSGEEETDITDYFIESAFPTRDEVQTVLQALEASSQGLSIPQLLSAVNVSKGRIEKTIALLSLESPAPIAKQGTKWQLTAARLSESFWDRAERLTALRRAEQAQMQEYVQLSTDHMAFLIRALDGEPGDAHAPDLPPLPTEPDSDLIRSAIQFLRRTSLPVEPRKRWPVGGMPSYDVSGMIANDAQMQPGKALCVWGDAGWGVLVRQGKYRDGHFADDLVAACVKLFREWKPEPAPEWVTCVPSRRHPDLVPDFGGRLAEALGLPFMAALIKLDDRPEQKTMANSAQQARNIDGSLNVVDAALPDGPVLLVDDMVDSRWTLTVSAWLLRSRGCAEVWPLALALTGPGR